MSYKPKYFGDAELHGQRQFCTDAILQSLDRFREAWGAPVLVSPVSGAVARFNAPRSKSQHSVDFWGDCNAVDLFPVGLDPNRDDLWERVEFAAYEAGISGIGLYPQARLGRHRGMVHIDRRDIRPGEDNTRTNPAMWTAWRKTVGRGWRYAGMSELTRKLAAGVFIK